MSASTQLGKTIGYLATPAGSGPWPGLIVIQEWWGLDAQTRSITDRFAAAGYLSFAPDLYHGELAQLGDAQTAMTLVHKYAHGAIADMQGAYDALKVHPQCTGKVGSVGFCFGGRMALLLGASRPLDALCTFYGGGMQQVFDQLGSLRSPVLGLFGDQDQSIPVGTVEAFDKLLETIGVEHEVVLYPNAGHAFFRDSDPSTYRPVAAQDAWKRASAFFAKNLSGHLS